MTVDLTTTYLGMPLPPTGRLGLPAQRQPRRPPPPGGGGSRRRRAAVAVRGADGARGLRSTARLEPRRRQLREATDYFPEMDGYNTGPTTIWPCDAKAELSFPVIASLNGTNIGGWLRYARLLEDAGADAIELNVNIVATDPVLSAAQVEAALLTTVGDVLDAVSIPVALKLGPFWSSLPHLARRLAQTLVCGASSCSTVPSPPTWTWRSWSSFPTSR